MTKTSPQICTPIKFRTDERKIYWRERTETGTPQVSCCWGKLPTERLEKFLTWLNDPTVNNRKKICRMVALPKLPKEKLRDSDFLKNEIFERLKLRQRQGKFFNKPSQFTPEQIAKIAAIVNEGYPQIRAKCVEAMDGTIKASNRLREIGKTLETLTGHKRFLMRDYVKFQSSLPEGMTPAFCRLAMSVWRNHPDEISALRQAMAIMRRAETIHCF